MSPGQKGHERGVGEGGGGARSAVNASAPGAGREQKASHGSQLGSSRLTPGTFSGTTRWWRQQGATPRWPVPGPPAFQEETRQESVRKARECLTGRREREGSLVTLPSDRLGLRTPATEELCF